jgi:uncharacterized protein (TIGR03435 family)
MRIFQFAVMTACAFGQTRPEALHFEVVSVKPPPTGRWSAGRLGCTGDRFAFSGMPLTRLIQWGYDLPPSRIQRLPDWITDWVNKTESMYEVEAKASSAVSEAQCKAMVRTVLADRFQMVSRVESKEMRVYALTVAKRGLRMREVKPGSKGDGVRINKIPVRSVATLGDLPDAISMAVLATRLSAFPILGVPVIDRTGLTGRYSFDLECSTSENDERPPIGVALEEQLGLKLEATKAPIEMLVVSHIEKPKAN